MMVVVFRPLAMRRDWFSRYCHLWRKQAAVAKEFIVRRDLTDWDLRQAWDQVNITPGRAVIWVSPSFIPHTSFFDELDHFRDEKCLIVAQKRYKAVFQPKADVPAIWEAEGLADFPIVFQLSGQRKFELPPASSLRSGPITALEKLTSRGLLSLDQYFVGNRDIPMIRSSLGLTLPECWTGKYGRFGRLITGTDRVYATARMLRNWTERIDAWETWLQNEKLAASISSTPSFARGAPRGSRQR